MSQKINCADFSFSVLLYISITFSAQCAAFDSYENTAFGLTSLKSSAAFLPSEVTFNILSILGSMPRERITSALAEISSRYN